MKCIVLAVISLSFLTINAQKQVAAVPFDFERGAFQKKKFGTFYVIDQTGQTFSYMLKDNIKVSYVLFNKELKVIKRIDKTGFANTPFTQEDVVFYNGSAYENKFSYVFKVQVPSKDVPDYFQIHTVDFNTGEINTKQLFTQPVAETEVLNFSNDGRWFHITTLNATRSLKIRILSANGTITEKTIPITLPPYIKESTLSEYLKGLVLAFDESAFDFPDTRGDAKLYAYDDRLSFVINWSCHPVYIFTIHLNDFSIKYQALNPFKEEIKFSKTSPIINSVIMDNKLFSLSTENDKLRISVHDLKTDQLIKVFDIRENFPKDSFAAEPVKTTYRGKSRSDSPVKDMVKEFKEMYKQDDAILVRKNNAGYYEITFGMHRSLPYSHTTFNSRYEAVTMYGANSYPSNGNSTPRSVAVMRSLSSQSGPTYYRADTYNQTVFRVNLRYNDLAIIKGKSSGLTYSPESDAYIEKISAKMDATNYYTFNGKQYIAYYEKKQKQYIIEEIIE